MHSEHHAAHNYVHVVFEKRRIEAFLHVKSQLPMSLSVSLVNMSMSCWVRDLHVHCRFNYFVIDL